MPRRHEPTAGRGNSTGTGVGNGAGSGASNGGTSAGTGALRGLVGAGPSQVGIVGALRARDVSRPTPQDVEQALTKPVPIARPTFRQDAAAQDAAVVQDAVAQDAEGSGSAGGTSVSS
jgi:hypothetical protein